MSGKNTKHNTLMDIAQKNCNTISLFYSGVVHFKKKRKKTPGHWEKILHYLKVLSLSHSTFIQIWLTSWKIKSLKAHQGKQLQNRFQKNNRSGIQKYAGSYLSQSSLLELEGV